MKEPRQRALKRGNGRRSNGDARRPRRIVLVVYPGAQVLDVTGPAAVFAGANRGAGEALYEVEVVSSSGRPVPTGSGVTIESRGVDRVNPRGIDTLLVVGGDDRAVLGAIADEKLRKWVLAAVPGARRYGSVCSGTFVLAAYGLLDGRRVATHWEGCSRLAEWFPALTVDGDALYVIDGNVWTSAGVTTGIDMALAMVEKDAGAALAAEVARRLVVYARRPGHQTQFSPLLLAQSRS